MTASALPKSRTPKPTQITLLKSPNLRTISAANQNPAQSRMPENGCSTLLSLFEERSFEQHFQPNSTILLQDEPADAVYLVASGTVRCCMIDTDGKRQIFSFVGKGGFVGISDFDHWHFTAEAVDHVILKSVPRGRVEQALTQNASLRKDFRTRMRTLLECREQQLLSLISTKASERLLHFLTDFAARKLHADYVVLPMCRRDIADHLGLSVETVSRAFSHLKQKGKIDLATHEKYKILA